MTGKNRSVDLTQVIEWKNKNAERVQDYVAAEEPLEMRCGRRSLGVTLRTPGNDEELVAGFLFTPRKLAFSRCGHRESYVPDIPGLSSGTTGLCPQRLRGSLYGQRCGWHHGW